MWVIVVQWYRPDSSDTYFEVIGRFNYESDATQWAYEKYRNDDELKGYAIVLMKEENKP